MKNNSYFKKITFVVVILILLIITVFLYSKSKEQPVQENFQEINNLSIAYSEKGLKNAVENNYIENFNNNYSYSNEIGCKVNSFILSDNDFIMTFDFDFSKHPVSVNNLVSSIIIYDENKNIYCDSISSVSQNYSKYVNDFFAKNNLSKEKSLSEISSNYFTLYQTKNNATIALRRTGSLTKFGKPEKLYVNIHGIGYIDDLNSFKSLYDDINWNLEIDVPEKFTNRSNLEFSLAENVEGFEFKDFYVTDTSSNLFYSTENDFLNVYIVDDNNNEYSHYSKSYSDVENHILCNEYAFNKNMVTNKLYLKIVNGSDTKIIELIQK